jgi:flavin reductase (DIM6/NTAB) family NADH-FMN oxidoreductase RutF
MGLHGAPHLELIRRKGSFTVNIPSASLAAEVDFCGTTPGAKTDKFAATGLTLVPSSAIGTPLIKECRFNLECQLTEEVTAGNYMVVIGHIVEAHADEEVLRDPGGDIVEMSALDPLVYIAGAREYWRLGEKVADAYSIGRKFSEPTTE